MDELIRRGGDIERRAWADLYRAAPPRLRQALGLDVRERGRVTALLASGVDHLLLNRALGLTAGEARTEADAQWTVGQYEARGVGQFWLQINSTERYTELPRVLGKRGIGPYPRSWMKFVRYAAPVEEVACALRIRRARPADGAGLGAIAADAFDLPPETGALFASAIGRAGWDYFVAEGVDGVVAASAIFTRGADGYLLFAATAPTARRRGAQRALMAARLNLAEELGCDAVFTETGMPVEGKPSSSYRNMLRAGFDELHVRDNFAPEGSRWQNRPSSAAIAKSAGSAKRSTTSRMGAARFGS